MLSMPLEDVRRSGSVAVADGDGTFSSERGRKRTTKQRTISRRYRGPLLERLVSPSIIYHFRKSWKEKDKNEKVALVVDEASCEGENKEKLVMMEISLPEVAGMMRDTEEGGGQRKF